MYFIPAPLSSTIESARAQFAKLLPHFDHFQIDVQDGVFVPSKTISIQKYSDMLESMATRDITVDFHLMKAYYAEDLAYIQEKINVWHHLSVRTVYVHTNIQKELLTKYTDFPISMTFNPVDSVGAWREYIRASEYAQVMTIHPGPQGQKLILAQLKKVGETHLLNEECVVCIDGSVNDQTLPQIMHEISHNIPEEMAVGSYFSQSPPDEVEARLQKLRDICAGAGPS